MKEKAAPFVEGFAEATAACLVTMVQGNVLALTLTHLAIASQTGLFAGLVAGAAIVLARVERRWVVSTLLGLATAVVDYFVHPGMFGPAAAEAIVTGAAAGALSLAVGAALHRWGRRGVARESA